MIYICKISIIHYEKGTADLILVERDNTVVSDVPFFSGAYDMPNQGDTVVAIFDGDKLDRGFILGKPYQSDNLPQNYGADVFSQVFKDGKAITYQDGVLTITVDKVVINNLEAETAKVSNLIETNTLKAVNIIRE